MGQRAKRDATDTLIELLQKLPDASTVEILLEPEHLLRLLRAHGWSDEDIRRDLKQGGRTPGELLLDVLEKQPDPAVLLAMLGNPAPRVASRRSKLLEPIPKGPGRSLGLMIFGLVLAVPSGWFLFVRLDFLNAPGLMFHFRGAYTLLFTALVGGLLLIGGGLRNFVRGH